MNDEEKKYIRKIEKMRPGLEVFTRMVQILKIEQDKINKVSAVIDSYLLKTYRTI